MLNVPQKHVGVHFGGRVYNFSNSQHKVVVDPSVEAFHQKFAHAYAGRRCFAVLRSPGMRLMALITASSLLLAGVTCQATEAEQAPPDPEAAAGALRKLLSMAELPIPSTSSCQADYGQKGRARVGDLVATRLGYLYDGTNRIEGACTAEACSVSITHAAGEDLASATIRFRLRHGSPQVASLQCVLTP
jgi:hypothetical protein